MKHGYKKAYQLAAQMLLITMPLAALASGHVTGGEGGIGVFVGIIGLLGLGVISPVLAFIHIWHRKAWLKISVWILSGVSAATGVLAGRMCADSDPQLTAILYYAPITIACISIAMLYLIAPETTNTDAEKEGRQNQSE